ncbi:MAG: hypothetical protein ACREOZ_04015, partial [Gloeomargaritales cyanobacterium]
MDPSDVDIVEGVATTPSPSEMKLTGLNLSSEINLSGVNLSDSLIQMIGQIGKPIDLMFMDILSNMTKLTDEQIGLLFGQEIFTIEDLSLWGEEDIKNEFLFTTTLAKKLRVIVGYFEHMGNLPPEGSTLSSVMKDMREADKMTAVKKDKNVTIKKEAVEDDDVVLTLKDSKTTDLPVFSGKWEDWPKWNESSRINLGYNNWLHIAESTKELTTQQRRINNSIYYALAKATAQSGMYHLIKSFEPKPDTTELADG